MNLAGMIRVSTEGQVDAFGKDVQAEAIERWAGLNGHTITEMFEEDAVSGKTDGGDRPALVSLLARANEFDGIVFFDATRIARRAIVQETLLNLVWATGLKVFTTTAGELDADEEDPTKILIRQILAVIAEFDHRSIVRRLHAARKVKSSRGGYIGGTTRYGLSVLGSGRQATLVPNEEEVRIITEAQSRRNSGESLRQIAGSLNRREIPTKTGKGEWGPQHIARMTTRPE